MYYYIDSPTAWDNDCTDPILAKPGESVSFLMNYTLLLSEDRYDQVSGSGWAWDNGIPWAQAVTALNTNTLIAISSGRGGGTIYINPSGGTVTMQHAPEPATMLLFGSGLIGLGWFGRKKTKKGSKV